jgi:predicted dehydrogenase
MQEVKWGIIGCGDVTEVKSGPAFNKVPNSTLVAVMRRDANKAADYAKRHGVPKWYADAELLINDPDVNAIYIATPPLQHEAYALAAIRAGKPVYVEKPMALNAAAAQRMAQAANEYQVKLVVAHYRRAQPMYLKIKQLLKENTIGDIRFIQLEMFKSIDQDLVSNSAAHWRIDPAISGGGLFHDLAPHQLDLMLYFFGPIKSATGFAVNQHQAAPVHDLVTGQLLFTSGVIFNGTWCFTVSENVQSDRCEIYGANGTISFPMFGSTVTINVDGREEILNFDPLAHVEQPMIAQVVDYFLGKTANPCTAEEAVVTMELMASFTQNSKA